MKTAVVIGSTGLIGRHLVEKLAKEGTWTSVLAVTRKQTVWNSPKIRSIHFDFKNWADLQLQIQSFRGSRGIDFFCCLGTTLSKAKTEAAFKMIDYEAVLQFTRLATRCQADQLLIVSAMGASANSKTFYSRVKGQMETDVAKEFTARHYFFRPSLLLGDRKEFRFGERVAILLAPIYSLLLPLKYKPVAAACVAKAMVALASKKSSAGIIIDNAEIHQLCKK